MGAGLPKLHSGIMLYASCNPMYGNFLGIHVSQLHRQHAVWQLDLCQLGAPFGF